ncbi:MAG: hypothetical protein HGB01_04640 [Chlorobiaceae bacterium]|nr:hypothetical protein [Chlorobiaceae bacterium]
MATFLKCDAPCIFASLQAGNLLDFNKAPRQQVIDFNFYSPLSIVDANEWPLQDEELTSRVIIPDAPEAPRKGGDRG